MSYTNIRDKTSYVEHKTGGRGRGINTEELIRFPKIKNKKNTDNIHTDVKKLEKEFKISKK